MRSSDGGAEMRNTEGDREGDLEKGCGPRGAGKGERG